MSEKIFEVTGNENPGIQPIQVSAKSNAEPKIESLGGSSVEPERVTVLESNPVHREIKVGQPLTEDDKARAVMNPFAEKEGEKPKHENASLSDIPGAQVVPIAKEQPYKDQGIIVTDDEGKKIKDEKFTKMLKDMVSGDMINKLIKRFDLQNINLAEEKAKIDAKKSTLSKSRRDAVVALWNMKQLQRRTLAAIAKPMIPKEAPTEEEINNLLDEVEENVTEHENAAKIVAHNIVQRAIENNIPKQEVPANVEEAMEAAKVDYTPGEGGNDEVTPKALHDAVEDHGRTKFRGVFSSLDMVENPQVGDVVHTIATDANGNHTGLEMVYTYIGPNHWKCEGSVHVDLPEEPKQEEKKPDLSKSMNDFVVRG